MKKLIATALVIASMGSAAAGCNSGSREGGKTVFGPGSTGNIGAGGLPGGGGSVPGTPGQFSAGAAMNAPRMQHTATTLPDGRVLVTGGEDGQGAIYQNGEVFDPVANAWEDTDQLTGTPADGFMTNPANNFVTARQLHTATLLPSISKVLVVSGLGAERLNAQQQPVVEALTTCFIFDPVGANGAGKDRFSAVAPLTAGRFWHNAVLLADGKVLIAGGFTNAGTTDTSAFVYDPQVGTWTAVGAGGSDKHAWGNLVTTPPGNPQGVTIFHAGADVDIGQGAINGFPTARTQKFANNAFSNGPTNVVGNVMQQAGNALSSGRAFFAGGRVLQGQNLVATNLTEIFDQAGNGNFAAGPNLNTPRFDAKMAEIGATSDQLVVSGMDAGGAVTPECEIFGAFANQMIGTVSMQQGRIDHAVVTLRSGQVMVIGGQEPATQPNTPPTVFAETEIYTR